VTVAVGSQLGYPATLRTRRCAAARREGRRAILLDAAKRAKTAIAEPPDVFALR
jgi:hypothetical protein